MNVRSRVKCLTAQRMQRRELSRQRTKELLLTDVLSGLKRCESWPRV